MTSKNKRSELVAKLGRQKVRDRLGDTVHDATFSNGLNRGIFFPPRWYCAIKSVAEEAGEECPAYMFGMWGHPPPEDYSG